MNIRIAAVCATTAFLAACGGAKRPAPSGEEAPARFPYVEVPASVAPEAQRAYVREHFWDGYDFADSLVLRRIDSMELLRAYALYAGRVLGAGDEAWMDSLHRRSAASRPVFERFLFIAQTLFGDPNSPVRNDELYIPALEAALRAPWLGEWERVAPEHDLRMARQNRIGHRANDLRYTTSDGRTHRLYDLRAEYVLLFFNNPGCPLCAQLYADIAVSPCLSEPIRTGRLKVLAVYPDEDLAAWREYLPQIPAGWIAACDRSLRGSQSYDLKAIPALYLLDAGKRVLVKDSASAAQIEAAFAAAEGGV